MLDILQKEGYPIGERELARLRKKHGLHMRAASEKTTVPAKRKPSNSIVPQLEEATDVPVSPHGQSPGAPESKHKGTAALPPEVVEKRRRHMEALQAESDQRYQTKTRRRRTRPWAGLPADPPGPPRFPSETTIDEAKQILSMNHPVYAALREQCQAICEEEGVRKKTDAGVEKWKYVQDRLINENEHLANVFYNDQTGDLKQRLLAVEVICGDVTKRMRTFDKRLTIQECKNILNINPEEARQLRRSFEEILRADNFVSKFEAGQEHWNELKTQWISSSPHLQRLIENGPADPEYAAKTKAMELLCRDVMKRLRDEKTKKEPSRKKEKDTSVPGKGKQAKQHPPTGQRASVPIQRSLGASTLASQALATSPSNPPFPAQVPFDYGNLQIDPKLLLAANNTSLAQGL